MANKDKTRNANATKTIQVSAECFEVLEKWKAKTRAPIKTLIETYVKWLDSQYEYKRNVVLETTPEEFGTYHAHILIRPNQPGRLSLPVDDPSDFMRPQGEAATGEELRLDVQKGLDTNPASPPSTRPKPERRRKHG